VITRRRVALAGGIGLLVAHRLGNGQPAATIRRVGMLVMASEAAAAPPRAAFKQAMHDLGWLEGKNVEYVRASAEGDVNRLDALARDLVEQKVDVIFTANSPATRAAQRATKTIPIVMTNVSDPAGLGYVASLARPGGNITGTVIQADELLSKLIQILHEVTPAARRFAILSNASNPSHAAYRAAAESACAALGLAAIWVVASEPEELAGAVELIVRQRSQAVVVVADPMYFNERVKLQALMQTTRLPVAYGLREHVVAGGLLSYSSDLAANFRYTAKFVDRILRGAKPADLPVEQPTRFDLVLNLQTAKALDLKIPQSVLLRADEVIR
jgi:putative tryptophan/tyrosine transport system substrate-binding protein